MISGERFELGDGGHRLVEHGLPKASRGGVARARPAGRRGPAALPVSVGLGAHQPDWRLPVAQQREDRRRQIQATTADGRGLAYFAIHFLRRPQEAMLALRTAVVAREKQPPLLID